MIVLVEPVTSMLSCFQTTCCEGELTTSDGKIVCGGCTVHAQTCAGGTGIFLRVKKCQIVLLSEAIRGNIQLGCVATLSLL